MDRLQHDDPAHELDQRAARGARGRQGGRGIGAVDSGQDKAAHGPPHGHIRGGPVDDSTFEALQRAGDPERDRLDRQHLHAQPDHLHHGVRLWERGSQSVVLAAVTIVATVALTASCAAGSQDDITSTTPEVVPLNLPFSPTLLKVLKNELAHILKNIPKNWDAGARLLALARPIVETIALSAGLFIDEDNRVSGRSGPVPASRISFLTIELFAHLWFFGSYTNACRIIGENPIWMKALQLVKKPNHTTLSHFRTELGEDFFRQFFTQITKLLIAFGLLAPDAS